ncbi:Zn-ribbon domain-containing OB-fold protein [Rhodococcus sp. NPDC056960]|uniref:Zn-ribbon domain-containing OB-fold protein n=1 Tax=Rhodococcus sp. NPDC056960 TaxID=3345982 RepID=UPI003632E24E
MSPRYSLTPHLEGLARHELLISACAACGSQQFPPKAVCTRCGSMQRPRWSRVSGDGRLWSYSVFHKTYLTDFHLPSPYVVAVIELDNGARIYGNLVGVPMPSLRIGQRVHAEFTTDDQGSHLIFVAADKERT